METTLHILYTRRFSDQRMKKLEALVRVSTIQALEPVPMTIGKLDAPGDWVIVSSPNALIPLRKQLENGWGAGARWAIIGQRTADMLKEWSIAPAIHADDAAELTRLLPAEGQAVFFCGKDRTPTIEAYMDKEPWTYEALETYETRPTQPKTDFSDFDAVAFFSPRNVTSMLHNNPWPEGTDALAIGHTTARALRDRGIDPTLVAHRPDALYMTQQYLEYKSHDPAK